MIATRKEQSKRLLELGIDSKTADMHYSMNFNGVYAENPTVGKGDEYFGDLPAWSLSALLKLLPLYCLHQYEDGTVYFELLDLRIFSDAFNEPIDAAVDMIEELCKKRINF